MSHNTLIIMLSGTARRIQVMPKRSQAGLHSYKISVKEWVAKTGAIGLRATAGRYGGTWAHKDIAFEFGMWISPEFKIYLIKEFQRLKRQIGRDKSGTDHD